MVKGEIRTAGLRGVSRGEHTHTDAHMISLDTQRSSEHCVMNDIMPMVGAAGFEPTTPRTPSECATGLRYAPTQTTLM